MAKTLETRGQSPTRDAVLAQFRNRDMLFGLSEDLPKLLELRVDKLEPNPEQPRRHFDQEALEQLASSIDKHGLLQPITVKAIPGSDRFIVVAGERRWRAHSILRKDTIFAVTTDGNADEIALIENLQREDLTPLEEAAAYQQMMERHHYTQEELGQVIGKAQNTISATLRLNHLHPRIKDEYPTSDTLVPKSLLIELAQVPDEANQLALWEQIRGGRLTVKQVRSRKRRPNSHQPGRAEAVCRAAHAALARVTRLTEIPEGEHAAFVDLKRQLAATLAHLDTVLRQ